MSEYKHHPFNRPFDSLEDFVDVISERLKCPVTLEDSNHQLLAYSSHDDRTDEARISTIIGRRVPERVINKFWKEGVIPKLNQSDEPLVIPQINDIGLGNRVAVSIRKEKEVLGYIWVLEVGRSLTKEDLSDLKIAASKAKSQLLQLKIQKKKKEKNHQELLWQMITGDANDHRLIKEQLMKIGFHSNNPLTVLVFSFTEMNQDLTKKLIYVAKTTQKINLLIQTFDENQLIILISPSSHEDLKDVKEFIQTFKTQVKERFAISDVISGCGYAYDDYQFVKSSYEEALKVVQLKQVYEEELGQAEFYHELGIFKYIDLLKKQKAIQRIPINPIIERLKQYDAENKTNLLESLEVTLDKDSNVNEAAKELHCHVNTLNYRLKRIQEITQVSLKDSVQKHGLYLDLKMLQQK
ncbi:transcriptional regulator [Alkalihalobacillus alcalophilus ATCC 27647 = CGMCC 1.3604]|uniref:Transcriptional regulator n=1 Tax=Alkalihalobacillus alcalophilus ATCC 27647 = CGMCC 1.3604 TaxID=1218173 RepID=A0A094WQ46_ALKAL|nr:helix-turn-helix domain-containing protein [Alkalihalobacillus alcalophilus]KGA98153.1 transcriptional regulator [Alkalihalobacillus alcalophilus ATCC 27647 = CGMCC 1.3604]MED1560854.1 helix-turn-helix domain-containing protein [Alkalihalobacillus alcalophilus]THG91932.1 transcriptional regulator [Alkalihalobacillus alcalophilus ATCC 27647 = CGMCC 1.3604]